MDPFAHTLVGAALAQTGLRQRTSYGTAALVIGANLPDLDGLAYLWGSDAGFCFRRGWTHGLPAVVLLPFLLTGLLLLFDLWRRPTHSPPRIGALLGLSLLAVATHPSLDWLNTYGMRWLMPVSGRWFYGDSVFIVDPWMWLVLGGAVFLGHSRRRSSRVAWAVAAGFATLLVLQAAPAGLWVAKMLWLTGLGAFMYLRFRGLPTSIGSRRWALAALALTFVYVGSLVGATRYARNRVTEELTRRGIEVERLMVGPRPVTPLTREVVVETSDRLLYGEFDFFPPIGLRLEDHTLPKPGHSPVIDAAFRAPQIQGFLNWVRFPFAEVKETESGYIVSIMDARYTRLPNTGFGTVTVRIGKEQISTE